MEIEKSLHLSNLILRLASGGFMLTHGFPKLMKFFAEGEIQFADPIGIGVTASLALAVFSEFFCSIAIIVGLKTRLAAIPLAVTMFVAAVLVHGSDPWAVKEKAILYLAMYIAIIISGGGNFSLDKMLSKD
jgi:putative oxidoreductase